jgi:transcriptional regulator with GAF, ATPase, and Fis domain
MMENTLEMIFQIFSKINRTALILVDPKTGDIADSVSKTSLSSDDTSFSYDLDVVSHVLKTNKPFQFLDAFDEYDDGISETLKVSNIRSVICLPLSDGSEIIGVMYIESIEKPNSFQREDLYLMQLLCEKVGPRLAEISH